MGNAQKYLILLQKRKQAEPPPTKQLFFLNTLPRQINTRYVISANGIIEANKIILA